MTASFPRSGSSGAARPFTEQHDDPQAQSSSQGHRRARSRAGTDRGIGRPAAAFCGFYVAKADSKLFNKSSKVVLAREGQTTAITMASDYQGEPEEFALVIPVPTFIERKQIGVVEMKTIDHIDAFTAPRLVEYHDEDPCAPRRSVVAALTPGAPMRRDAVQLADSVRYRGVTIEANYDVGEYDVIILSATESDGLTNWLNDNDYKIPSGAEAVLGSLHQAENAPSSSPNPVPQPLVRGTLYSVLL